LKVWVDHSKAPTNFGPDIMVGSGDVVGSPAYHADLTLDYGVQYVWRGRTTVVNGQNALITPRVFGAMLTPRHPFASMRTMAKEIAKVHLGRRGHPRWEMYAANRVLRPNTLRDGRGIWEFLRSTPFWDGTAWGDTPEVIGDVLSARMLSGLIRRQGVCILYTHLGKVRDPHWPFNLAAQQGFRRLAGQYNDGRILVLTTYRLLRYLTVRDGLKYDSAIDNGTLTITIDSVSDPVFGDRVPSIEELQGMTFSVSHRGEIELRLRNGTPVDFNVTHHGEKTLITVPWQKLEYPQI
jgi:hypothetical protein